MLKEKYNLAGREVISTFGLLHPGKGIEYVLKRCRSGGPASGALYLVLGRLIRSAKAYGNICGGLRRQVKQLGIEGM